MGSSSFLSEIIESIGEYGSGFGLGRFVFQPTE